MPQFSDVEAGEGRGKGFIEFDSRTKKGFKQMGKLFKEVGQLGHPAMMAASAFGEIANKMGIMDAIMKGLSPLFDIMSSLMSVLSSSIMQALMPAIQPLIDMLPTIIPLIQMIGEFIGRTIAIGLEPLLTLLEMFLPIIEPILPIFLQLMELGLIPLTILFEVIFSLLEPLLPYLEDLAVMFEDMAPAIDMIAVVIGTLIRYSFIPLVAAIYGIGYVIATLMDVFTLYTHGYTKQWQGIMLPILESLATGAPTGGTEGGSTPALIAGGKVVSGFQSGTELIMRSGMVQVEAGESIQPAGYRGASESYLEELVVLTKRKEMLDRREAFFNRKGR